MTDEVAKVEIDGLKMMDRTKRFIGHSQPVAAVNLSVINQSVIFQSCKFRSVNVSPSFFVGFVSSVIFQSVNFQSVFF